MFLRALLDGRSHRYLYAGDVSGPGRPVYRAAPAHAAVLPVHGTFPWDIRRHYPERRARLQTRVEGPAGADLLLYRRHTRKHYLVHTAVPVQCRRRSCQRGLASLHQGQPNVTRGAGPDYFVLLCGLPHYGLTFRAQKIRPEGVLEHLPWQIARTQGRRSDFHVHRPEAFHLPGRRTGPREVQQLFEGLLQPAFQLL